MKRELPEHYWDFIEEYLPGYTHRDDVLKSDIFTRFLDGEEVNDDDIEHFFANRSRREIEEEYLSDEWDLFMEAFESFATSKYGQATSKHEEEIMFEQLNDNALIPRDDGTFYVVDSRVYKLNEFFRENEDCESFIFEVTGSINDDKMSHFNGLFKEVVKKGETRFDATAAGRMRYLRDAGCDLKFVDTVKKVAKTNLIKCGGKEMPSIVGGMLKKFYYENATERTTMEDCIEYLAAKDVAGYEFEDLADTYRGKIAHLLLCAFTGMRLDTKWDGRQRMNGEYIVVKKDGDVVAFHSTIADEFKDFLVAKMIMESLSQIDCIYKEEGKYYLRLELRIGFPGY